MKSLKCGKPDKLLQFVHKQYSQQKKQHFIEAYTIKTHMYLKQ